MFGLFEDPFFSYGSRRMLKRMMDDDSDDVQTFLPIEPAAKRARKGAKDTAAAKDASKHAPSMQLVPHMHWADLMSWTPRSDIRETERAYVIEAELPGVPKDAIKIEAKDNVLTISGKKETAKEWSSEDAAEEKEKGVQKAEKKEKKEKGASAAKPIWHRVERSFGSFQRSYVLPEGVDLSAVTATAKDGTLTITVPKPEKHGQKVHTIAISN